MKQANATTAQVFDAGRDITRDLAAAAGEAGELLKDLGSHTLESARETLDEAHTAIRAQGHAMKAGVRGYVDANPWWTLGAVAAAGVMAGLLLGRR